MTNDRVTAYPNQAGQAFTSLKEAIGPVLHLVERQLGMSTPFLARTESGTFEVLAVAPGGGCRLKPGDTLPLGDSY